MMVLILPSRTHLGRSQVGKIAWGCHLKAERSYLDFILFLFLNRVSV